MPLPNLTPEQRAEIKNKLKYAQGSLGDIIKEGQENDIVGKMKVSALLEALPGVGKVRAKKVMDEIGISETRRVRGLGANQITALVERFDD